MNRILLSLLFLAFFSLIFISCQKEEKTDYSQWRESNEAFFHSYKDSVGYSLITIPAKDGGGQYYSKSIVAGDPNSITASDSDIVVVNYKMRIITKMVMNGTYLEDDPRTDQNATPREFYPIGTITGFKAAVKSMKVGEIRSIVLPFSLGYGGYGAGYILPYSTLLFDIQLIKIKPKVK